MDGCYRGDVLPSSEWRMHMDFYLGKPDCGAVVHCHSPRATALSCHRKGIPAFHYMVALAGGDRIECSDYASFGTRALSEAMIAALGDRMACLLANHGQIAGGPNLKKALSVAEGVEDLADQYLSSLVLGEPVILNASEMTDIMEKFKTYGKQTNDLKDGQTRRFRTTKTSGINMRLGIDWGGTKIEIIALSNGGEELFRTRVDTPKDDYDGCLQAVKGLVDAAEQATGQTGTLGLGIPGSLSPRTGLVKNANSTWMNGKPLDKDLEAVLGRPVRIQNDANCLAVSEATDGAGAGAHIVHAIIIGTGSGSGIAIDAKAHLGANGIGGEWGGIGLPWLKEEEFPGPESWIGHRGVLDMWCSGTGFQWEYKEKTGTSLKGP